MSHRIRAYRVSSQLLYTCPNWKDLKFYKTSNEDTYHHIDSIFSGQIDWKLIESMFPDMLRVALSIKAGTIAPSTILRRLGTYSRKNKLYYAFKELGLAVRTMFLLNYLADLEVRKMISVATNKSERFNQFAQFLMFGSKGVISENTRDEQRKIIKNNHLVANLIMMHTVVTMSNAIDNMQADGHSVDSESLSCLSPYQTEHINRFGENDLDSNQEPVSLEPAMNITILENVMSRL